MITAELARAAELADAPAGHVARIRGRVTASEGSQIRVHDLSGCVTIELAGLPMPPLGGWVEVVLEVTDRGLELRAIDVAGTPHRDFPRPSGEWLALHDARQRMSKLIARADILRYTREFFASRKMIEVETPLAVPSPGLDLHLDAFSLEQRADRFLITSPEYQMKRLLAGGFERIFQIARCFRRDELGQRHQPEFTMLEWYRTFAGADDVMRDTEELVAQVAQATLGTTRIGALELAPPWPRLTVDQCFRRFAGISAFDVLPDEERFYRILTEQIEPELGRDQPVFLTEWPASMASLARLLPGTPPRADRFEAFVNGMELCNGFGELVDPVEQRHRLLRDQDLRRGLGRTVYPLDEAFLEALEEGVPPSGGNALGFDRLVMLITGADHIDEVVAFPESRG